jgi:hypothetical protein
MRREKKMFQLVMKNTQNFTAAASNGFIATQTLWQH